MADDLSNSVTGGESEMHGRVHAFDWSTTPLGPRDSWPQSLRTAATIVLNAPVPMVMLWGPEGVMIYNDAYSVFAGGRHPQLLGSNVREGWPEVADFNDNVMKVGLAGGTLAYRDQELTLHRHGRPEQVWMDLDYWPLPGDDGKPAGVVATVVETTDRALADRERNAARGRLELALSAGDGVGTWDWDVPADCVFADERFARIYGIDPEKAKRGAPVAEFFGAIHPHDSDRVQAAIAEALATGETFSSEYRLIQADGGVRWVTAQGRASLSPEGQPLRFPGVTFDITARRRMIDALAESEARYRTLFDTVTSGFCIIEMKFDEAMRPIDYKIVEGNPAFAEMTGLHDANGKWVSEIAPGLEQHWFDLYGEVALTGEPARFENPADIFGRWYDVQAMRIGDADQHRVAILFNNITQRKQLEARQKALIDLNDAIRDLTDPAEIAHASSRILAETLNVSRVGYGVMDTVAETVTIERDYNAPGVASLAGVIQFRDFGSYIENLARGEAVIFADAAKDPRVGDGGAALAGISATSLINLPLIEQGKVVALLFVNNATPRPWSDEDIALVREVAERVRTATERARASADLRESEARFRNMADNTPMMMWVTDPDGFCTYLNRTWYEFTGQTEAEAEGFGWLDATHPDDKARTEQAFVAANAAREPFRVEYRLRRADGVYRWAIDAASPRFDANGEYLGYVGSVIDIDERREAEEALRASEAQFRAFAQAVPNHVWASKPDGEIYWFNDQVYQYAGDDVADRGWRSVVHPDDLAVADAAWGQALETGETYQTEFRVQRKDGAWRWFAVRAEAVRDEQGVIERWVGANLDIDDLKLQGAELARLNADLEERVAQLAQDRSQVWQVSPDLIGVANDKGYWESVNPAWQTLLGWTKVEIKSRPLFDLIHPDDVGRTQDVFTAAIERGEPAIRFENRYRTKSGDYRWLSWVAVPEGGKIYSSARDITDEKAVESERKQLWRLSEDMLARANYGGAMSAVSPAWTRTLGWSEHELLTNAYADIIHPDDIEATTAALVAMGETGQPTRYENRILSKDGVWKPIGWTVAPEADGINFIAVGRDLTDDKENARLLAQAQDALRQSQKMEAVGQLTGGIAHDFNNLLAGISGSLELLGKRLAEGRTQGLERYIDAAQGASQRAAALTQRLLAFSRRQTLDPRPTDVNRLIGGMEELIRRSVGPDVEVEVVGSGGLWPTRIDQSQLENALLNLCINARDAMAPDGGRLTIETSNKWLDERGARERDLTPGQYVSLCVSDTGSGMTPEIIEKIFDPFFTTKPMGQGTGLGLSMIHGFVRQSGGQVRVYSEVGEGTTMCLYLPRHVGDLETDEVLADRHGVVQGHGETILVIDDEPTVRMLVAEVLRESGYSVIEAHDGPTGLRILNSDAKIDLLVSDVGLPGGMNGRQVADAARAKRPNLKVLFITGYAENAAVGNGLLDPGMEVITKPFTMTDLSAKVVEMIDAVS